MMPADDPSDTFGGTEHSLLLDEDTLFLVAQGLERSCASLDHFVTEHQKLYGIGTRWTVSGSFEHRLRFV